VPHLCGFYPGICLSTEEKVAYISILLDRPIYGIEAEVNRVRYRALLLRKDFRH
jgi:tetrahydromethanopterin S-methyltransferase subunit F